MYDRLEEPIFGVPQPNITGIDIPFILISEADGLKLRSLLKAGDKLVGLSQIT
jgi:hypothetical protein